MSKRYPLRQIILDDLMGNNKVALLLLVGVIMSALATIWVTHHTRLLIAEQGKLAQIAKKLENQYIHLRLEENTISHKSRIESVAEKFGLQPVQKEQEVILIK